MKKLMIILVLLIILPVAGLNQYMSVPVDTGDGLGTLEISVLCHHNLFSNKMYIKWKAENWSQSREIQLSPDGLYDGRYLPGIYDVWLVDGNGGQSEYQTLEITKGELTSVFFIGHAVSGPGISEPVPTVSPTVEPTQTPIPTVLPTITPIPTQIPTVTPTPTQTPCHIVKIWHPGYWSDNWDMGYWIDCFHHKVWHEGYFEEKVVC